MPPEVCQAREELCRSYSSFSEIQEILGGIDVCEIIREIEDGFVAYSQGRVEVPPVGELIFDEPRGDVHIKYGYIHKDDYYVIKIASGFYDNTRIGLPTSSGMMLLFSRKTGVPLCILLDEGHPSGILNRGGRARWRRDISLPGRFVAREFSVPACRAACSWNICGKSAMCARLWCGGSTGRSSRYRQDMEAQVFAVRTTMDAEEIAATCTLIVTATPSCKPLLRAEMIRKGTHITAMGSDTPEKQELDPRILEMADRIVVDSIRQCLLRGEAFHVLQPG